MTSPRALLCSLAATVCGFVLVLVVVIGQASQAATPVVASATVFSPVSVVAQEIRDVEPVAWTVAWESARREPLTRRATVACGMNVNGSAISARCPAIGETPRGALWRQRGRRTFFPHLTCSGRAGMLCVTPAGPTRVLSKLWSYLPQ